MLHTCQNSTSCICEISLESKPSLRPHNYIHRWLTQKYGNEALATPHPTVPRRRFPAFGLALLLAWTRSPSRCVPAPSRRASPNAGTAATGRPKDQAVVRCNWCTGNHGATDPAHGDGLDKSNKGIGLEWSWNTCITVKMMGQAWSKRVGSMLSWCAHWLNLVHPWIVCSCQTSWSGHYSI